MASFTVRESTYDAVSDDALFRLVHSNNTIEITETPSGVVTVKHESGNDKGRKAHPNAGPIFNQGTWVKAPITGPGDTPGTIYAKDTVKVPDHSDSNVVVIVVMGEDLAGALMDTSSDPHQQIGHTGQWRGP